MERPLYFRFDGEVLCHQPRTHKKGEVPDVRDGACSPVRTKRFPFLQRERGGNRPTPSAGTSERRRQNKMDDRDNQAECARGKACLSPMMKIFNGEIVAYSLSRKPNFARTKEILRKASAACQNVKRLVVKASSLRLV